MELVPVSDEILLRSVGIFYKSTTLRSWFHTGKHAQVFKKIMNRLFIDLAEWEKLTARETQG